MDGLSDEDITLYLAITIAIAICSRRTWTRTRERVCIKACQNIQKLSFLTEKEKIVMGAWFLMAIDTPLKERESYLDEIWEMLHNPLKILLDERS